MNASNPFDLKHPEPKALASTIESLAARFGNRLVTSQAVRDQHAHTMTWLAPQSPDAVVMAQETADVQDVVRICAANRVPVIAFGTGTSLEGQVNAPAGGICIDLRDMDRVLDVHVEDLDCVIQPGITRKTLNENLRDQGVFFPIDPGADASIGGMASTRASGTNAVRYGTMRDNILALKVVRGDGEIITTGTRAKKSSAGYDLTHLFVGAEGTLGIISELTIKLRGIPDTIAAAACSFATVEGACQATILAIQTGIPLARIELLNAAQVKACNAYSKLSLPETPLLLLEFHGNDVEVAEQTRRFSEIAQECGGGSFEWTTRPEDRTRLWQARHDAYWAQCALRPKLWNGRVLLLNSFAVEGDLCRGAFFEAPFADLSAWRAWGFPPAGAWNCFAMGALRTQDGAFLLGEMGAHTINHGDVYFPCGTPDFEDVRGTHVDLLRQHGLYASMWDRQREATEAEERLRIARETDELGVVVRRRTAEVS